LLSHHEGSGFSRFQICYPRNNQGRYATEQRDARWVGAVRAVNVGPRPDRPDARTRAPQLAPALAAVRHASWQRTKRSGGDGNTSPPRALPTTTQLTVMSSGFSPRSRSQHVRATCRCTVQAKREKELDRQAFACRGPVLHWAHARDDVLVVAEDHRTATTPRGAPRQNTGGPRDEGTGVAPSRRGRDNTRATDKVFEANAICPGDGPV
jgi:hypothetical protein